MSVTPATLPKPAAGTRYPQTIAASNLATAQSAFTGTVPTERQIHNMIATAPGGNLEDFDWMNYLTNTYQNGALKGRILNGNFGS